MLSVGLSLPIPPRFGTLERIADRVTNICERTTFMVTGNRAELKAHGY